MIVGIIGLIIGFLIFLCGLYYFCKEKNDVESQKIYGITITIGVIIDVVISVVLFI